MQPYYDVAFLLHLQVQKLKTRGQLSSRQDNAIILRDMINDRLRILAILLIVWSLKIYSNKKLLFEYFTRFYSRLPVNGSYLSATWDRVRTQNGHVILLNQTTMKCSTCMTIQQRVTGCLTLSLVVTARPKKDKRTGWITWREQNHLQYANCNWGRTEGKEQEDERES